MSSADAYAAVGSDGSDWEGIEMQTSAMTPSTGYNKPKGGKKSGKGGKKC